MSIRVASSVPGDHLHDPPTYDAQRPVFTVAHERAPPSPLIPHPFPSNQPGWPDDFVARDIRSRAAQNDRRRTLNSQGLIISTPHPSKSDTLRVATAAPRTLAVAAIMQSITLIGRP